MTAAEGLARDVHHKTQKISKSPVEQENKQAGSDNRNQHNAHVLENSLDSRPGHTLDFTLAVAHKLQGFFGKSRKEIFLILQIHI